MMPDVSAMMLGQLGYFEKIGLELKEGATLSQACRVFDFRAGDGGQAFQLYVPIVSQFRKLFRETANFNKEKIVKEMKLEHRGL